MSTAIVISSPFSFSTHIIILRLIPIRKLTSHTDVCAVVMHPFLGCLALKGTFLGDFVHRGRRELQIRQPDIIYSCNSVLADINSTSIIRLRTDQRRLSTCPDLEPGQTYLFTGYIDDQDNDTLEVSAQKSIIAKVGTYRRKRENGVLNWMKSLCKKFYGSDSQPAQQQKSTSG